MSGTFKYDDAKDECVKEGAVLVKMETPEESRKLSVMLNCE